MAVYFASLFTFIFYACAAHSAEIRVIDGDTIDIGETRYRIHGIDAPEQGQKCNALGDIWPCGKAATKYMDDLVRGAHVTCAPLERDRYRRAIARCRADGRDLGAAMISAGLAWAFTRYSDEYLPEEAIARSAKRGVWRAPTQPAWVFRAERWKSAEAKAPDGCPIKGNISPNGKIYHPPWSPWYARTRINLAKGERWFCDEAEALAAGWRAPRLN